MIALADCNNFYASCERVFNPKLKNQPVIVLSNNDGCIIARSNEAKALGIKMGEPAFKIKNIIEKNNIYVFSTNFSLFGDEAQYWLWSKKLDIGYLSKPPLISWMIMLHTFFFGDSFESLKLFPIF